MNKITVKKSELLTALRQNRGKHVELFQKAFAVYRDKLADAYAKLAVQIGKSETNDDLPSLHVNLQQPMCYEKEYSVAIEMLEWHDNDGIELTQDQFRNYVRDDWDWTSHFNTVASGYTQVR